jgi:hypothetical protein
MTSRALGLPMSDLPWFHPLNWPIFNMLNAPDPRIKINRQIRAIDRSVQSIDQQIKALKKSVRSKEKEMLEAAEHNRRADTTRSAKDLIHLERQLTHRSNQSRMLARIRTGLADCEMAGTIDSSVLTLCDALEGREMTADPDKMKAMVSAMKKAGLMENEFNSEMDSMWRAIDENEDELEMSNTDQVAAVFREYGIKVDTDSAALVDNGGAKATVENLVTRMSALKPPTQRKLN